MGASSFMGAPADAVAIPPGGGAPDGYVWVPGQHGQPAYAVPQDSPNNPFNAYAGGGLPSESDMFPGLTADEWLADHKPKPVVYVFPPIYGDPPAVDTSPKRTGPQLPYGLPPVAELPQVGDVYHYEGYAITIGSVGGTPGGLLTDEGVQLPIGTVYFDSVDGSEWRSVGPHKSLQWNGSAFIDPAIAPDPTVIRHGGWPALLNPMDAYTPMPVVSTSPVADPTQFQKQAAAWYLNNNPGAKGFDSDTLALVQKLSRQVVAGTLSTADALAQLESPTSSTSPLLIIGIALAAGIFLLKK